MDCKGAGVNEIEFHAKLMQMHFNAGRVEQARWHCTRFTALMRAKVFNDGTEASGLADTHPACQPSPIKDELRGE